jgi:hypothetical protein
MRDVYRVGMLGASHGVCSVPKSNISEAIEDWCKGCFDEST